MSHSKLKIAVLGTRGFPNIQGGVETHCENLYPHLVEKGCEVIVFTRKPYVDLNITEYKGITLIPLQCLKNKFLEAFLHTFIGIFAAKKVSPDILHVHAIGPSLFIPLARLLGLKVVMTNHGPDYERKKWNKLAKGILKFGEKFGSKWSNQIICISETIAGHIKKKYNKVASVIPNGVIIPQVLQSDTILRKYGLTKGSYILSVGRFVPEKGFHDLIDAFNNLQPETRNPKFCNSSPLHFEFLNSVGEPTPCPSQEGNTKSPLLGGDSGVGELLQDSQSKTQNPKFKISADRWKLVIVGKADHEDRYSLDLKDKAGMNTDIVLTGFLTGTPLWELYSHAGLFVLPSYYEGLPIVLLEAMSYGLSCIVSDIPANREVELSNERFFAAGDTGALSAKMREFTNKPLSNEEKTRQINMIRERYDWQKIAEMTMGVYKKVQSEA